MKLPQLSLRELFLLVVIAAMGCGWWVERSTYCFSKKLENHEAAIAMFVAYYNFVWRTRHPDKSGRPGKKRPTAAMMAKIVPDLWDFDRLYEEVIQYG